LVGTLGRDPEEKLSFNFAGTSSQQ
jgi:hypothetical protein